MLKRETAHLLDSELAQVRATMGHLRRMLDTLDETIKVVDFEPDTVTRAVVDGVTVETVVPGERIGTAAEDYVKGIINKGRRVSIKTQLVQWEADVNAAWTT